MPRLGRQKLRVWVLLVNGGSDAMISFNTVRLANNLVGVGVQPERGVVLESSTCSQGVYVRYNTICFSHRDI